MRRHQRTIEPASGAHRTASLSFGQAGFKTATVRVKDRRQAKKYPGQQGDENGKQQNTAAYADFIEARNTGERKMIQGSHHSPSQGYPGKGAYQCEQYAFGKQLLNHTPGLSAES